MMKKLHIIVINNNKNNGKRKLYKISMNLIEKSKIKYIRIVSIKETLKIQNKNENMNIIKQTKL